MTAPQTQPGRFGWLVTNFAERVPGVAHAIVVSADGLLLTSSDRLPPDRADQIAAVASALVSLGQGAARCFDAGGLLKAVVEMDRGIVLLMSISDGSCLVVLAAPNCDIGLIGFEMTGLVDRVGQVLTPELRAELRCSSGPDRDPAGQPEDRIVERRARRGTASPRS
jgi:predicted regulator of Ras-like GTPase activity (Roadblock/LC7/MglB family)